MEPKKIEVQRVHLVPGLGSYYREDIEYLQEHPTPVEDRYTTVSLKQGMVRVPSEIVSVGFSLADGHVVWGDAVGVAFDGKSGRSAASGSQRVIDDFSSTIEKLFAGKSIGSYRSTWDERDAALRKLPLSLQYGISQTLLAAAAHAQGSTLAGHITEEWGLKRPSKAPSFHGSCGADRFHAALKMMVHRLPSHPAGQGDNLPEVLGSTGEKLVDYLEWWKKSVQSFGADYKPTFHFDLHGLIGRIFQNDIQKITGFFQLLEKTAKPYPVRIESPIVAKSKKEQIEMYATLRASLKLAGCSVSLVVDEWANTLPDIRSFLEADAVDWVHIKMPDLGPWHDSLEAVQECKKAKVGALLGGSCIETQISATTSYHLALAIQPELVLLKPGMGFDEALSLARNEMARTLAAY